MTDEPQPPVAGPSDPPPPPTWRERTRPAELLAIAGVLALFAGLVSFASVRDVVLSLVFGGVAFILSLVVLAMLALTVAPDGAERAELDGPPDGPDGPTH